MGEKKIKWTDSKGNCRCESCGKSVPASRLQWDGRLGYCASCYREIVKYNKRHKK